MKRHFFHSIALLTLIGATFFSCSGVNGTDSGTISLNLQPTISKATAEPQEQPQRTYKFEITISGPTTKKIYAKTGDIVEIDGLLYGKYTVDCKAHLSNGGPIYASGTTKVDVMPSTITEAVVNMTRDYSLDEVKVKGRTFQGSSSYKMWGDTDTTGSYAGAFSKDDETYTIPDFYISKYEITRDQYTALMSDPTLNENQNLSATPWNNNKVTIAETVESDDYAGFLPANNLTWYDAMYFCNLLSEKEGLDPVYSGYQISGKQIVVATVTTSPTANGYRLPTSEEWEYAARGGNPGSTEWFYTYSGATTDARLKSLVTDKNLDAVGWYCYNRCTGETEYYQPKFGSRQVGLKKPNSLCIYDMSGNVFEWCGNEQQDNEQTELDLKFTHTLRGGSYYSRANVSYCAVTYSFDYPSSYIDRGFRPIRYAN